MMSGKKFLRRYNGWSTSLYVHAVEEMNQVNRAGIRDDSCTILSAGGLYHLVLKTSYDKYMNEMRNFNA